MALRADVAAGNGNPDARADAGRREAQGWPGGGAAGGAATGEDDAGEAWGLPDFVREFRRAQSLMERAVDSMDTITYRLTEAGVPITDLPRPPAPSTSRARRRRFDDPRWELLARPGVGRLQFGEVSMRKIPVSIDGAKPFLLTPALADLLAELAGGDEIGEDGFPAFRSYAALAAALRARTRRRVQAHAVVVGIGRLRERLLAAGNLSPRFVETAPKRGARLRIRRRRR